MDRTTKIIFGVAIGLLLLCLIVGGCTIALFYKLANTTQDAMAFLEECPLPEEFNETNMTQPTQDDVNRMLEWCCTNYDNSREICQLLAEQKELEEKK